MLEEFYIIWTVLSKVYIEQKRVDFKNIWYNVASKKCRQFND